MSNLSVFESGLPAEVERPAAPFSRSGRAMARNDQATTVAAHRRYNGARLAVLDTHLGNIVEKARNDNRADLAQYAIVKTHEVYKVASTLADGASPALQMALGDLLGAYNAGEAARILKRGYE